MFNFVPRKDRNCHNQDVDLAYDDSMAENSFILLCSLIAGILGILCFLGVLKGLIGYFLSPRIGIYGLYLLIDLPRPLSHYQEKHLECRVVVYDVGGWPVHPDTLDRSVRILSKRTEFCLNVVFFLAYPLAALTFLCGLCCCIKNCDLDEDDACYRHVDVIKLKHSTCCGAENGDEDEDAKYVLNAMKCSRESLRKFCSDECTCTIE